MRPSELVLAGYFLYAAGVAFWLPVASHIRTRTVIVNLVVLVLLAGLVRWKPKYLRDWFPLPLMILAYKEMGWFALPHASTRLEEAWVWWDRLVLYDWGARRVIEAAGPAIPLILELAYPCVYLIPGCCLALLYREGMRSRADELLFCVLVGTFLSYSLFPFFPSEPPRTVYPGQDLPSYQVMVRRFNHWFLGNWGIHTSVFPSAHVSSAYAAAFGMRRLLPENRIVARGLFVLATLIAIAVFYGRYHYLVDALAGLAIALLSWRATARLYGPAGR